jgi:hypothetical protein
LSHLYPDSHDQPAIHVKDQKERKIQSGVSSQITTSSKGYPCAAWVCSFLSSTKKSGQSQALTVCNISFSEFALPCLPQIETPIYFLSCLLPRPSFFGLFLLLFLFFCLLSNDVSSFSESSPYTLVCMHDPKGWLIPLI